MSKPKISEIHYLHYAFHFATELFQCAEILNRLRQADALASGEKARSQWNNMDSTDFEIAMKLAVIRLHTAEDLATSLTPEEIKKLRDQWESEVMTLVGYIWDKYQDTMNQRIKRHFAIKVMQTDADVRVEAKKMRAAAFIGHAGPKSVDALLASKKAQGGIYDLDPRLFTPDTDTESLIRFLVPPVPIPPRPRRKNR